MKIDVRANYQEVLDKIAKSASDSGRDPSEVTLVGVTKRIEFERIKPAIDEGLSIIGEIVGTEFKRKLPRILDYSSSLDVQVVGELQSNKVKFAVENCQLIQSVKNENILSLINKYAKKNNLLYPILLQVDFSSINHYRGLTEKEVISLIATISDYSSIEVKGLMTMAPRKFMNESKLLRKYYTKTTSIFQEKITPLLKQDDLTLSMGMTGDYTIAIEEGSNMVRLGTAIFGPRL